MELAVPECVMPAWAVCAGLWRAASWAPSAPTQCCARQAGVRCIGRCALKRVPKSQRLGGNVCHAVWSGKGTASSAMMPNACAGARELCGGDGGLQHLWH